MGKALTAAILILSFSAIPSNSQVRIELPAREYAAREGITARVVNSTHHTIAYCTGITFFGWSETGKIVSDITFSPFEVLYRPKGGKWGTVAEGVDFGGSWRIDSLEPSQSQQYTFKVRMKGERRLVLEYDFDKGENIDCSDPYKKWKRIRSRTFIVR
jgi:hypothetical protein